MAARVVSKAKCHHARGLSRAQEGLRGKGGWAHHEIDSLSLDSLGGLAAMGAQGVQMTTPFTPHRVEAVLFMYPAVPHIWGAEHGASQAGGAWGSAGTQRQAVPSRSWIYSYVES